MLPAAAPSSSSLPPVPSATVGEWHRLAAHLRQAGLTAAFLAARQQSAEAMPPAQRMAWLEQRFLSDPSPAGELLRLFAAMGPAPVGQWAQALTGPLVEFLLANGCLESVDAGLWCPFRLEVVRELYLFTDRPGAPRADTVMEFGPTTRLLLEASLPSSNRKPVGAMLDLGCGAGGLALLHAAHAQQVTGVDLNPRAVAMAQWNAAINGIPNATFLAGDLYGPVAGQQFDLIVSQPPFVPRRPDQPEITYMHAGDRGDRVIRRVVAEAPAHLRPGGQAFVLADLALEEQQEAIDVLPVWANPQSSSQPESTGGSTVVFAQEEPVSLELHAQQYFAQALHLQGDAMWQQTRLQVEHLQRLGVACLRPTLTVLTADGSQERELIEVPAARWGRLQRAAIEKQLALLRLRHRPEQILPLRLRIHPESGWRQEGRLAGMEGSEEWTLVPPPESLFGTPVVTQAVIGLLQVTHEAESVAEALATAQPEEADAEAFRASALAALVTMLRYGLVEVAE